MKKLTHQELSDISEKCLDHLAREEDVLSRSLECLHDIRESLLVSDLTKLRCAVEKQAETETDVRDLDECRRQFQGDIGNTLGISAEEATVHRIAEIVAEEKCAEMLQQRDRLGRMALEAAQLNRGNHALINSSLDLMQNLFERVTGQLPPTGRYGSTGSVSAIGQQSILSREY